MASNRLVPGSGVQSHGQITEQSTEQSTEQLKVPGNAGMGARLAHPASFLSPRMELCAEPTALLSSAALPPGAQTRRTPAALPPANPMPGAMVGRCAAMERLFLQMRYLSGHLRVGTIDGERGTGRRMVAETLHGLGPAREAVFLSAQADRFMQAPGLGDALLQAEGGTLYLEQVDALDARGQELLLRLLRWVRGSGVAPTPPQSGVLTVGPRRISEIDGELRLTGKPPRAVLVSSRHSLASLVSRGRFRGDLLQQLSLVQLRIPPLRERGDDLELLACRFALEAAAQQQKIVQGVSWSALDLLRGQHWPGNLVELRLAMQDAVARVNRAWIQPGDLRLPWRSPVEAMLAEGVAALAAEPEAGRFQGVLSGAPRFGREGREDMRREQAASSVPECGQTSRQRSRQESRQESRQKSRQESGQESGADGWLPRTAVHSPSRLSSRPPSRRGELEPDGDYRPQADLDADPNLDRAIVRHIRRVLDGARGNKLQAARLLGISRSTLYRLLGGGAEDHAQK